MRLKNHLIEKATLLFLFVTLGFASCKAAIPIDTTAPASVTNLQAKSLEGKILLTWTDPADTDLSGIKISNNMDSESKKIFVNKGIQKYEFTNLEPEKEYTFNVSTVDLSGNESTPISSKPCKILSSSKDPDKELPLSRITLPFNEWGPNYQKVIPISDLVNTEDIILGDVLKLHMTGVLEHDSKEIETYIVSTAPEDSWWSLLSPEQTDGTSDFVFAENEKTGSSFDDYYEMPVVKIKESTNFSDVYLCFKASLRDNEDADIHEDSVSIMLNISAELDKTNRISPVTVTLDAAGGICNKTSFIAYPGYNLKMPEIKKDKMFLNGWKDSQGDFVQKVPASDILLTAEWTDRLDLTKYGVTDPWEDNLYHINGNILYQYPDAVLV